MKPGDFLKGKYALSDLTRNQRKVWNKENAKRPVTMTEVPESEWLHLRKRKLFRVWASRYFLAQAFQETGCSRLSISRVTLNSDNQWADKIEWEELQQVKRECGFGDYYAIEIYPKEKDIVNVANMRHLWILHEPLDVGWSGK